MKIPPVVGYGYFLESPIALLESIIYFIVYFHLFFNSSHNKGRTKVVAVIVHKHPLF